MKYMGRGFGELGGGEVQGHWCVEANAVAEHVGGAIFLSNAFSSQASSYSSYIEYNRIIRRWASIHTTYAYSSAGGSSCNIENLMLVVAIGAGIQATCASRIWSRVEKRFRSWVPSTGDAFEIVTSLSRT